MSSSKEVLRVASDCVAAQRRIRSSIVNTMCIASRTTKGLFFKAENFQHTGSFKLRGALSKLTSLDPDVPIITASSGNHGIACSHAAMTTGHKLTVVLPENVAKVKLEKIQSYGTDTILNPGDSGLSEKHAQELAANGDFEYVSPYNDPLVMSGQGTIGLELLEQMPVIDNVFISMGGGGLISGIGSAVKAASPETKIIGVSAVHSAALAASIIAGKVVETEHLDTLADGCAGGVDKDAITLSIASEVVDELVQCSEKEIEKALRLIAWKENMIVEGAAGLALAGYISDPMKFKGQTNVVVLCGANFDKEKIESVLN
ncbi:MAG: threonine dehydratase [Aestuariivita sp.]|nr:threonine dehydratase [Aestuariivita sp.]